MGLRVNTNLFSMTAQRNLGNVSSRLAGNFARLSSGLRIATAADDAAGLGISERMRAQIRSLHQAGRNANDGVSLVQTAEGSLGEVSANLVRMRELAVQASNGTLNTGDRAALDAEFQALVEEIDRVHTQTTFNGVNLFDASTASLSIQVGTESGESIDITLVGRRIWVVVNGRPVITDQIIPGTTGSAIDGDESAPGPIMLQGEEQRVEFRNVTVSVPR